MTGTSTTNSITITGATAGTYDAGTVKVAAKNDCGTSATSNSMAAVTVSMIGETTVTGQMGTYNVYCYPNNLGCWMTDNSKEGTSFATTYSGHFAGERGYYYAWIQASDACPSGYHLPGTSEWEALVSYVNGSTATTTEKNYWFAASEHAGDWSVNPPRWEMWDTWGFWWVDRESYYCGANGVRLNDPAYSPSICNSVRCVKSN